MKSLPVRASLALSIVVICQCVSLCAEKKTESPAIAIGRPITETVTILRDRKIDWHPGNTRQVTRGPNAGIDDSASVAFNLDKGTYANVTYSKRTNKITDIELSVYPVGFVRKISESHFAAKSLRLEDDGSFVVHLLPRDEPKPTPDLKPEFPTSKP